MHGRLSSCESVTAFLHECGQGGRVFRSGEIAAAEFPGFARTAATGHAFLGWVPAMDQVGIASPGLAYEGAQGDGVYFVILAPANESRINRNGVKHRFGSNHEAAALDAFVGLLGQRLIPP